MLVFRSFSKAWGLAGLRIGYAIGGHGAGELLAELEPDLGVSEVSQAGALEALHSCSELVGERRAPDLRGAPCVTSGLRARGFDVSDSQANFVWAAHPELDGGELASRGSLARACSWPPARRSASPTTCASASARDVASERLLEAVDKVLER